MCFSCEAVAPPRNGFKNYTTLASKHTNITDTEPVVVKITYKVDFLVANPMKDGGSVCCQISKRIKFRAMVI